MPSVSIRSSKDRVCALVRTRMAISPGVAVAAQRLGLVADHAGLLLESHRLTTLTFSPAESLRPERSVLPSRPSLCAIRPEAAARIGAVER